jgi:hypothetical protein
MGPGENGETPAVAEDRNTSGDQDRKTSKSVSKSAATPNGSQRHPVTE